MSEQEPIQSEFSDPKADLTKAIDDLVLKHRLAVDSLTEKQLAEVIRQAIASGDFVRHITQDGSKQSVSYIPWREVERLKPLYNELLYAVERKFEGETRHETALRYIREKESCSNLSSDSEMSTPKPL